MKRFFSLMAVMMCILLAASCRPATKEEDKELFVVGFSQSGSESD